MIIERKDLPRHRGKVAMVDGGFDPLHAGHIGYFKAASELGLPVFCNLSPDTYVSRKHPPFLGEEQRVLVLDAIRYLDFVHLSRTSTADVLRILQPRYYAKGIDWKGQLPSSETRTCDELGIEIVYLDTVTQSSTDILDRFAELRDGLRVTDDA